VTLEPPDAPLVLIVDDDEDSRRLLELILKKHQFRVASVSTGEAALEYARQHLPAVVLLDVLMPGMDGFDTCRALRALPGGEHLPIVMLTTLEDDESIDRAYRVGATDFATKPVQPRLLGQRLRYVLRSSYAMRRLALSEARLASAQRIAELAHWDWDIENNVITWSEELWRIFGLAPERDAMSFASALQRVHPEDREKAQREFVQTLKTGKLYDMAVRVILPDGTERTLNSQAVARINPITRRAVYMQGTVQDITARRRYEERIRHLAYYDSVTTLPNRVLFKEQLSNALVRAQRSAHLVGVMFIDLDRFKRINDSMGHSVGDALLRAVASRLSNCLRGGDAVSRGSDPALRGASAQIAKPEASGEPQASKSEPVPPALKTPEGAATLARQGGDEFTVLLSEIKDTNDAAVVARRIIEALVQPVQIENQELVVTASVGVALYPQDGEDVDTLLRNADAAMYHAKEAGRNNFQFYARALNIAVAEKLELEQRLRTAVRREEFVLHYQPVIDLVSGRCVAAEALLRWQDTSQGLLFPSDFLSVAEESGLIAQIGNWTLTQACKQAKLWEKAGLDTLPIVVNISGLHLKQRNVYHMISRALEASRLDPRHLEIEVSERVITKEIAFALNVFSRLHQLGVRVAVKDYGTAYSSLLDLRRLSLDAVKIDPALIREVPHNADYTAIVSAIIALAHRLGTRVVAPAVETKEQLEFLSAQGCDEIQGYLVSKPLPATEFEQQVRGIAAQPGAMNLPAQRASS
jgi:PAS domain S-box-containing protein